MREWLFNIWQLLKVCISFIPALYMISAVLILIGTYCAEYYLFSDLNTTYTIFKGDVQEARDLMIGLMQAMVTMTTFVVSITMIVLSLAATQLGPRLIKSFLANKTTHQYVAYFFCAVIMCAFMIGILHHEQLAEPVPSFTISFVLVYCFLSFCLLLGFTNHVAQSCIADNVVFRVYDHAESAIRRITIDEEKLLEPDFSDDFDEKCKAFEAGGNGFIQNIDYSELLEIAANNKLQIRILAHAGDFVVSKQKLFEVYSEEELDEDLGKRILKHIIIGNERTPTQDIEYSFRHLTEIGLRALSPGINDHQTAKVSLNYITSGLADLFEKFLPNVVYYDDDHNCRIVGKPKYAQHLVEPAILPIMDAGQNKSDILHHVLDKIHVLSECAPSPEIKDILMKLLNIAKDYISINFDHNQALKKELELHANRVKRNI